MKPLFFILALATCLCLLMAGTALAARPWEHPVIKAAGEIVSLPKAEVQPDPALDYKIVFDITKGKAEKGKLIPGLAKVARLINVFASAGTEARQVGHGAGDCTARPPRRRWRPRPMKRSTALPTPAWR